MRQILFLVVAMFMLNILCVPCSPGPICFMPDDECWLFCTWDKS